jgi:hypothetical protein
MAVTHWYDALLPYVGNDTWDPGYQYLQSKAGGAANAIEGNPAGASAALSSLMNQAYTQGGQINTMLQGEKGNSEAYLQPMQKMFGTMYGTGGKMPVSAPSVPGSATLNNMFAGGKGGS